MSYILLIFAAFLSSFSGIGATYYNRKNALHKDAPQPYVLVFLGVVFMCWLIKFLTNPCFDIAVIPYSILFTLGYTTAVVCSINAYKEGPMMLSSLITQLSMISTTIWGFFFWNSKITANIIIGLLLVITSLILCLYNRKDIAKSNKKVTSKWIIYISLYFIGNSVASIVQVSEQIDFNATYGDFFMALSTLCSLITYVIIYLKSSRSDAKQILKSSWYIPAFVGVCNFIVNFFIITLATLLSASIVYPVLMIGALAITSIFSIFIFKEKMGWWQWIGVVMGTISILLLSV